VHLGGEGRMIERLTEVQMRKWKELVKAIEEGKLFRICNSCGKGYKVLKNSSIIDMCDDCLKGVVIPTF